MFTTRRQQTRRKITILIIDEDAGLPSPSPTRGWRWLCALAKVVCGVMGAAAAVVTVWTFVR